MGTPADKVALLLVDDERPLLTLLNRYLERRGFDVQTAETGAAAIACFADDLYTPHMVVLDLGLPDMRGETVLEHILAARHHTKVLVSSGAPFSPDVLPPAQRTRVAYLQKPYMPNELLALLHGMQSEPAPEA